MKKLFILAGVILVAASIYLLSTETPEVSEESGEGYKAEKSETVGSQIKNTFRNLIPGPDKAAETLPDSPHVVVIHSIPQHIELEDAIDRIEAQKDLKDHEAFDFAHWCVVDKNARYTVAEKEQILERATEILRPNEKELLLKDTIGIAPEKSLQEKAMNLLGQTMDKQELETYVKEVLYRNPPLRGRQVVIDYAATRNIYVK